MPEEYIQQTTESQPLGEPARVFHPSTEAILRYFAHAHLPAELAAVSAPFGELAIDLAHKFEGPELTVCLRKLLEAKDCAVRCALPGAG